MTAMSRVTQRMMVRQSLTGLSDNQSRLSAAQRRTTSGKAITKPSDDPSATMTALRLRSEKARTDQFTRNAQDGQAWLGTIDTTLSSMSEQVRRVRELPSRRLADVVAEVPAREAGTKGADAALPADAARVGPGSCCGQRSGQGAVAADRRHGSPPPGGCCVVGSRSSALTIAD